MDSLIDYLVQSDFFTAPASTRFHNCFPGGLCLHSLNLMHSFRDINKRFIKQLPSESVVLCGLLHDLCKVGTYVIDARGTYTSIKSGTKAHATISLSRINKHIKLTQQEEDIIRYHMGLFGIFEYEEHDVNDLYQACRRNQWVQIFAALDMADSRM